MTLKKPVPAVQDELWKAHRDYFTSDGEWSVEKTTFQMVPLPEQFSDPWEPVLHLPDPLVELLLSILRNERGLPFITVEHPLEYLTATTSRARKYAPHVARMIYNAFSPKLDTLKARQPNVNPRTQKQLHASTYRVAQTYIHAQYVVFLKGFLHRLIWPQGKWSWTLN